MKSNQTALRHARSNSKLSCPKPTSSSGNSPGIGPVVSKEASDPRGMALLVVAELFIL